MNKLFCDICGRRIKPEKEDYWNIQVDVDLYTDDHELAIDNDPDGYQVCTDCHKEIEESAKAGKIDQDLRKTSRPEKVKALMKALLALGLASAEKSYNEPDIEGEE